MARLRQQRRGGQDSEGNSGPPASAGAQATPPVVGLVNLGNTCYFNSAVQLLAACPLLTSNVTPAPSTASPNASLRPPHASPISKGPLGFALQQALTHMAVGRGGSGQRVEPYNPQALHAALVRVAPQFKGWEQHDSQEALHALLDGLQEEAAKLAALMQRVPGGKMSPVPSVDSAASTATALGPAPPAGTSGKGREGLGGEGPVSSSPALAPSQVQHGSHAQPLIAALFRGTLRSTVTCQACAHSSDSLEPFLELSLPIPTPAQCRAIRVAWRQAAALPTDGPGHEASVQDAEVETDSSARPGPRKVTTTVKPGGRRMPVVVRGIGRGAKAGSSSPPAADTSAAAQPEPPEAGSKGEDEGTAAGAGDQDQGPCQAASPPRQVRKETAKERKRREAENKRAAILARRAVRKQGAAAEPDSDDGSGAGSGVDGPEPCEDPARAALLGGADEQAANAPESPEAAVALPVSLNNSTSSSQDTRMQHGLSVDVPLAPGSLTYADGAFGARCSSSGCCGMVRVTGFDVQPSASSAGVGGWAAAPPLAGGHEPCSTSSPASPPPHAGGLSNMLRPPMPTPPAPPGEVLASPSDAQTAELVVPKHLSGPAPGRQAAAKWILRVYSEHRAPPGQPHLYDCLSQFFTPDTVTWECPREKQEAREAFAHITALIPGASGGAATADLAPGSPVALAHAAQAVAVLQRLASKEQGDVLSSAVSGVEDSVPICVRVDTPGSAASSVRLPELQLEPEAGSGSSSPGPQLSPFQLHAPPGGPSSPRAVAAFPSSPALSGQLTSMTATSLARLTPLSSSLTPQSIPQLLRKKVRFSPLPPAVRHIPPVTDAPLSLEAALKGEAPYQRAACVAVAQVAQSPAEKVAPPPATLPTAAAPQSQALDGEPLPSSSDVAPDAPPATAKQRKAERKKGRGPEEGPGSQEDPSGPDRFLKDPQPTAGAPKSGKGKKARSKEGLVGQSDGAEAAAGDAAKSKNRKQQRKAKGSWSDDVAGSTSSDQGSGDGGAGGRKKGKKTAGKVRSSPRPASSERRSKAQAEGPGTGDDQWLDGETASRAAAGMSVVAGLLIRGNLHRKDRSMLSLQLAAGPNANPKRLAAVLGSAHPAVGIPLGVVDVSAAWQPAPGGRPAHGLRQGGNRQPRQASVDPSPDAVVGDDAFPLLGHSDGEARGGGSDDGNSTDDEARAHHATACDVCDAVQAAMDTAAFFLLTKGVDGTVQALSGAVPRAVRDGRHWAVHGGQSEPPHRLWVFANAPPTASAASSRPLPGQAPAAQAEPQSLATSRSCADVSPMPRLGSHHSPVTFSDDLGQNKDPGRLLGGREAEPGDEADSGQPCSQPIQPASQCEAPMDRQAVQVDAPGGEVGSTGAPPVPAAPPSAAPPPAAVPGGGLKRLDSSMFKRPAAKVYAIEAAPPCLILHLKRFQHGLSSRPASQPAKINGHVGFPFRLDIAAFMGTAQREGGATSRPSDSGLSEDDRGQDGPTMYELVALIEHQGSGLRSGHYVAYVRRQLTSVGEHGSRDEEGREGDDAASQHQWYRLSDATVKPVGLAQVAAAQAYVLLYIRSA